jgi:hypothetical protein
VRLADADVVEVERGRHQAPDEITRSQLGRPAVREREADVGAHARSLPRGGEPRDLEVVVPPMDALRPGRDSAGRGDDERSACDEGPRVLDAHEPFGLALGGQPGQAALELHEASVLLEALALLHNPRPTRAGDAWVAVIANELLLEGHVPSFGLEGRDPWLLRCRTGSSHPSCAADADGDNYPDLGDCNDENASIHPGASTVDERTDLIDYNCDTWP